jgi:hypothetical protein
MSLTFEQAWQSVLDQLQMDMPKASFDTWVRDTRAVSFENNVLTVGARNAYARDWLESRLVSTVSRLLVGILNTDVVVSFVVISDKEEEHDDESEDQHGGFTAEPVDVTRYRDEVHPDHIVMLDAYCLRLMEQGDMTAKEMSLWVGFRQAVWRQWKIGQGAIRNIPHWQVMEFAMMSRASYFRELSGKTSLAGGHVELVPEPVASQSRNADRRMDNANRYRVWMAPRLTRHDCAVIEMILRAEATSAGSVDATHQAALAVLKDLSERDVMDWIDQEAEIVENWPRSVQEIVRRFLDVEGDLSEELRNACEKVYDRILGAFGKVLITHYFLRVVVPVMQFTHAQAWAIITLRDRCWYDHDTQTQKEFVIVRRGLEGLAQWVRVTTKSVTGWLKDPAFSAFIRQADMSRLDVPSEWLVSGTGIFLVHLQEPLLGELLGEQAWKKRDSILEKLRLNSGKSETLFWKKRDSILEKMRLYLGKCETRLNNLIKPYINHNKLYQPPTTSDAVLPNGEDLESVVAVNFSVWDLDRIFKINHVHPKMRKELTGVDAQKLISWLLYAVSEEGSGIESPLSFALDRLSLSLGDGAGGRYEAFASLLPAKLIDLILGRAHDHGWDKLMRYGSRRPRILLPILLGEDAPKESRTVERTITKTYVHYPRGDR